MVYLVEYVIIDNIKLFLYTEVFKKCDTSQTIALCVVRLVHIKRRIVIETIKQRQMFLDYFCYRCYQKVI